MNNLMIAIASDHAGYELKITLIKELTKQGYIIIDEGPYTTTSVDYPDYAKKVAKDVINGLVNKGILICYTGIGMSITCNKYHDIRGALVSNVESAELCRQHNNANILCLGAKDLSKELAIDITKVFLTTSFLGERHLRRINKIKDIENEIE